MNDLGLMNENNQKARCVIVTEMRYGFKLKEFNETNRRSIEYCIEKSRHNLRIGMARPDSFPFKKEFLDMTKKHLDAYQWYLDVYDEVMTSYPYNSPSKRCKQSIEDARNQLPRILESIMQIDSVMITTKIGNKSIKIATNKTL